jgi:hypothetical protein
MFPLSALGTLLICSPRDSVSSAEKFSNEKQEKAKAAIAAELVASQSIMKDTTIKPERKSGSWWPDMPSWPATGNKKENSPSQETSIATGKQQEIEKRQ